MRRLCPCYFNIQWAAACRIEGDPAGKCREEKGEQVTIICYRWGSYATLMSLLSERKVSSTYKFPEQYYPIQKYINAYTENKRP